MIKICHMTNVHNPEDVRIFYKECVSLASQEGYDVTLVECGESYEKSGVHIVGVGERPDGRLGRMLFFARKVYKAALNVNADIYHFHDAELLPYGLKLKKKGKTVIFDSHEHTAQSILEKDWIPSILRKALFSFYSKYQKEVCKKLDAIITVTPNIVEYFKKINPVTVQITNFPIYIEGHTKPKYTSKRLFFAGNIAKILNHHRVLQALERLPDCRYCLCGTIKTKYGQQLKTMKTWGKVDYMGQIPHEKVPDEMAKSAIGLALAEPCRNSDWHNGTMGNTKIFEEMMAGLPVVCTDFVLWKEFVERYHCGICVNPDNVDEIVAAVQYLLNHPDEARRMGENGRRAVREEFNWGIEEKKLFALYEKLAKEIEK